MICKERNVDDANMREVFNSIVLNHYAQFARSILKIGRNNVFNVHAPAHPNLTLLTKNCIVLARGAVVKLFVNLNVSLPGNFDRSQHVCTFVNPNRPFLVFKPECNGAGIEKIQQKYLASHIENL